MSIAPPFPHAFDPAAYSAFYLLNCVPESAVQAAILESLQWRGIPAVAVDAGAAKLRGRAYRALKASGQNARGILAGQTGAGMEGFPDIIGTIPGRLLGLQLGVPLFIEVKAPRWIEESPKTGKLIQKAKEGLPTIEQLTFLGTMHDAGAVVGIAWSVDDLDKILAQAGLPET